jgi:hypothetical protein
MAKYHINPESGEVSACRAKQDRCPFGGLSAHYASKENAQQAYELSMASQALPPKHSTGAKPSASALAILRATEERRERDFGRMLTDITVGKDAQVSETAIRPTYELLTRLASEKATVGTMFERAARLRKAYSKEVAGSTGAHMLPEELHPHMYLQIVAPATNAAVHEAEDYLQEADWHVLQKPADSEKNRRLFSELMKKDMSKDEAGAEAVAYLQANGWDILETQGDNPQEQVTEAILRAQEKALSYWGQFKYEQSHLL